MPKLSFNTIIEHQIFFPKEWREWIDPRLLSFEKRPDYDRKNLIGRWGEQLAKKVFNEKDV